MNNGPSRRVGPLCFAGLVLASAGAAAQTPVSYGFSVVPQFSASELHADWAPLLQRLTRDTGVTLALKISATIPRFETEVNAGTPDFVYLNPYHLVMARSSQGYVPLLRDSRPLSGILLVRRDGPYKQVQDLDGQVIGFPAPNAFGASLYMRALLAESVKIRFESRFLKTHPNVYRNVAHEVVAAGGSVAAAFDGEAAAMREQLVVIYTTPAVASHPIAVHPRVPEAVRKAFVRAFLALAADDAGRALLKGIRTPQPVTADYERDYLPLVKLNLQKYLVVAGE